MTFCTIFSLISFLSFSVVMASLCWALTTTVSTRMGMTAPPSFSYSIVTCVFVSGLSHGKLPLFRASFMALFNWWDNKTVRGRYSLVSSVA